MLTDFSSSYPFPNFLQTRHSLSPVIDFYAQHFVSTFDGTPLGSATLVEDSILLRTDPSNNICSPGNSILTQISLFLRLQSLNSFTISWTSSVPLEKEQQIYHRLISLDPKALSKEIKLIRFEDVDQDELVHTNVSSAIKVFPNVNRSSILSWNGLEDAKIRLELIQ